MLRQKLNRMGYRFLMLIFVLISTNTMAKSSQTYTVTDQEIIVTSQTPSFTIKLQSNPTTGYSWSLNPFNTNLLILQKHKYVQPNSNLMGAPGFELWTFTVKNAAFNQEQETSIVLKYARPWENDVNVTTIQFNIKITK